MPHPIRVGLIGFGNIGTGFVRHVVKYRDLLESRVPGGVELVAIADKEFDRPRDVEPPEGTRLTTNWRELTGDDSIDLIVELVGVGADGKPTLAREIAVAALSSGKHFVTANKGLIAAFGAELHEISEKHGGLLLYEASVGAGIPIIASMQTSLAPDEITAIHGMVNGTCNYILGKLQSDPTIPVEKVIKEAQDLGYAEPDPTFDVEGHDSAYKIVILGSLGFGQELRFEHVRMEGLRKLGESDFEFAFENGSVLKVVASAVRHPDGSAELAVGPAFLPETSVLAGVNGVYNAVLIMGEPIGDTMYYGAGAGQPSTASGLLADVMLASRIQQSKSPNPYPLRIPKGGAKVLPPEKTMGRHYLRFADAAARDAVAKDLPGTPHERPNGAAILVTDRISLADLDKALGKLADSGVSLDTVTHVRFVLQ